MTKKFLGILAMLSIATMTVLSSCTAAGVECGLIGKWECEGTRYYNEDYGSRTVTYTLEFTSDDKVIWTIDNNDEIEFKIKSVNEDTIKCSYNNINAKIRYRNLSGKSVEFKCEGIANSSWWDYTKVN